MTFLIGLTKDVIDQLFTSYIEHLHMILHSVEDIIKPVHFILYGSLDLDLLIIYIPHLFVPILFMPTGLKLYKDLHLIFCTFSLSSL